jgi:hypothetical protein
MSMLVGEPNPSERGRGKFGETTSPLRKVDAKADIAEHGCHGRFGTADDRPDRSEQLPYFS